MALYEIQPREGEAYYEDIPLDNSTGDERLVELHEKYGACKATPVDKKHISIYILSYVGSVWAFCARNYGIFVKKDVIARDLLNKRSVWNLVLPETEKALLDAFGLSREDLG